jgi:hypothetical protein
MDSHARSKRVGGCPARRPRDVINCAGRVDTNTLHQDAPADARQRVVAVDLKGDVRSRRMGQLGAMCGAKGDDPMAQTVVDGEDEWLAVDDDRDAAELVTLEELQAFGLRNYF